MRRALAVLALLALPGCSLADERPVTPPPAPTASSASPPAPPSPVTMTHQELCDWSAQLAGSFGQDPAPGPWALFTKRATASGQTELARIGDEVLDAIRASEFDRVRVVFEKDLRAECLPNG